MGPLDPLLQPTNPGTLPLTSQQKPVYSPERMNHRGSGWRWPGDRMAKTWRKECILPAPPPCALFTPQNTVIHVYHLQAGEIRWFFSGETDQQKVGTWLIFGVCQSNVQVPWPDTSFVCIQKASDQNFSPSLRYEWAIKHHGTVRKPKTWRMELQGNRLIQAAEKYS